MGSVNGQCVFCYDTVEHLEYLLLAIAWHYICFPISSGVRTKMVRLAAQVYRLRSNQPKIFVRRFFVCEMFHQQLGKRAEVLLKH